MLVGADGHQGAVGPDVIRTDPVERTMERRKTTHGGESSPVTHQSAVSADQRTLPRGFRGVAGRSGAGNGCPS
ncbi:hypothetical protein GCM10010104_69990 [Streptomyces indiaensis]|uniref:FAD binding domain-containing protein n=1 Tax=Streptomyces indiaensis TaxID=284033 RepID=A0ABN3ELW0_9ACTN